MPKSRGQKDTGYKMIKTKVELDYWLFKEAMENLDGATRFIISLDKSANATYHPVGAPLPADSVGGAVVTISDAVIAEVKKRPRYWAETLINAINRNSMFLEFYLNWSE